MVNFLELQKHATAEAPVSVDLYDCEGLGGGGSGAAGGLLHPFTSRGKVILAAMDLPMPLLQSSHARDC